MRGALAGIALLVVLAAFAWSILGSEPDMSPLAPPDRAPVDAAEFEGDSTPSEPTPERDPAAPVREADATPRRARSRKAKEPRERVVSGRVLDELGLGVADAQVMLRQRAKRRGMFTATAYDYFDKEDSVTTNADGSFKFVVLPGDTRGVFAQGSPKWSRSRTKMFESHATDIALRVQRQPNLGGRIVIADDSKLLPSMGVTIAFDREQKSRQYAEVDEEGRFSARVPPGATDVMVELHVRPRLEFRREEHPVGEILHDVHPGDLDLVLEAQDPVAISGVVEDEDGRPIRKGLVYVRHSSGSVDPIIMPVAITADGTFETRKLQAGRWSVLALPQTGDHQASGWWAVNAPSRGVRLRCRGTPGIRGQIEGDDVGGFEVHCWDADGPLGGRGGKVLTEEDGSFHVRGLRDGPHRLYICRPGEEWVADLTSVSPSHRPLRVRLVPGLAIEGRVESHPEREHVGIVARQAGVEVRGELKKDGRFQILGLSRGDWQLSVFVKSKRGPYEVPVPALHAAGAREVVLRQ